jgi:hypothetical protein
VQTFTASAVGVMVAPAVTCAAFKLNTAPGRLADEIVQVPEVLMLQVPETATPGVAAIVTLVSVPAFPQAGVDAPCVSTCPLVPGANTVQPLP